MAAKPKPQVANDKTAFWTYPRTSLDDGICYHIRDQRKAKHADIEMLEEHPLAKTDPAFENMVFVSREPHDRVGAFVRDWYVPKTLVDDLVSVSKTGSGARSSLLYPVGTEPPEGDSRVELLDHCRGEMTFDVSAVNYPAVATEPAGTTDPANLIVLTRTAGVSQFTGDEVYIDITDLHANTVIKKYVDGVVTEEFTTGVHKIARHVVSSPTSIHVEVPAQATTNGNSLGGNGWKGRAYTAKYILEGTTDSEDAPGILRGKFMVRNFNYRLGDVGVTTQRDETLGVKIVTERRVVPESWSYNWAAGYPTNSTADCNSSKGYSPISELVTQETKQYISGSADSDLTWYGYETVSIPKIVKSGSLLWAWAVASVNGEDQGYLSYDDDIGLDITTGGGGSMRFPSKIMRKFVAVNDGSEVASAISGVSGFGSHLYTPNANTYTLAFMSWSAFAGANHWAKARVRTWSLTDTMVLGNYAEIPIERQGSESHPAGVSFTGPEEILIPRATSGGHNIDSIWDNSSWTPYNVRVQRGRWCYWIIDFVWVKYPNKSNFFV